MRLRVKEPARITRRLVLFLVSSVVPTNPHSYRPLAKSPPMMSERSKSQTLFGEAAWPKTFQAGVADPEVPLVYDDPATVDVPAGVGLLDVVTVGAAL